jgi:alanine racemase
MKPATYVVLNVNAVQHNLAVVRTFAPNAKIMAVVKANGYGHGLLRIAEAAQEVDGFGVARLEEAIQLRQAGFKQRILLLEGFGCLEELQEIAAYQLEAVIHCFEQIELLENTRLENIMVWLKLDTGMNRLGFKSSDFTVAYQRLTSCPSVNPEINFMTHLANADDKKDGKTLAQIQLFKETLGDEVKAECSIANSAGLLAWQESLTDWVRPGLMLYGISPFPEQTGAQLELKPVMNLYSRLIAVKQVDAGETIGYSGTWTCSKPTRLGVIAVGYGDGYPRHAKNGTPVLVNGKRVPLIGRVSMDMITVDLTSQPDAKMGDEVMLWGEQLPVEEIALCADTIPYTLVCGITRRVHIDVSATTDLT